MKNRVLKNQSLVIVILLLFACPNILWAQNYIVTEVNELKQDLSARTNPKHDLNGQLFSILKITPPNMIKSVAGTMIMGEMSKTATHSLVYLAKGAKSVRIVFKDDTNQQITFSDWGINDIQAGGCFEIVVLDIANLDEYVVMAKARALHERGKYKAALPLFEQLSKKSNNEEFRVLGTLLMAQYYREVEQDMAKAYKVLYSLPEGEKKYFFIGGMKIAEKKIKEGIDNLVKAEQCGSKEAVLLLFRIYKGEILSEHADKTQAFKYGIKMAALGNVDAQHFVACCYLGATGVEYNIDNAIEYLSMAASQGKVESQRMLGAIYLLDNKKDIPKARIWLKMAANQKDKDAIDLLNQIGWD